MSKRSRKRCTHPRGPDRGARIGGQTRSFEDYLLELGLSRAEWQQLKELVLEDSYGCQIPIPEALAGHKVALLVAEYRRTGREGALNGASALLIGSEDSVWLALDKS